MNWFLEYQSKYSGDKIKTDDLKKSSKISRGKI